MMQQPLKLAILQENNESSKELIQALTKKTPANLEVCAIVSQETKPTPAFTTAQSYSSIQDIAKDLVNLAIITSALDARFNQAKDFLEQGISIFVPAPFTTDTQELSDLQEAADANNAQIISYCPRMLYPSVGSIHFILKEDIIGKPLSFDFQQKESYDLQYRQGMSNQSGVSWHLGFEALTILQHWFGPITEGTCEDDAIGGVESNAKLNLNFNNKTHGHAQLSWNNPLNNRCTIECEYGKIEWDINDPHHFSLKYNHCPNVFQSQILSDHSTNKSQRLYRDSPSKEELLVEAIEHALSQDKKHYYLNYESLKETTRQIKNIKQNSSLMRQGWLTVDELSALAKKRPDPHNA